MTTLRPEQRETTNDVKSHLCFYYVDESGAAPSEIAPDATVELTVHPSARFCAERLVVDEPRESFVIEDIRVGDRSMFPAPMGGGITACVFSPDAVEGATGLVLDAATPEKPITLRVRNVGGAPAAFIARAYGEFQDVSTEVPTEAPSDNTPPQLDLASFVRRVTPMNFMDAAICFGTDEAIPAGEEFDLLSISWTIFRPEEIVIEAGVLALRAVGVGSQYRGFDNAPLPEGLVKDGVVGGIALPTCKPALGITLRVVALKDVPAHFSFYVKGRILEEGRNDYTPTIDGLPVVGTAKEIRRNGHVTYRVVKEASSS